MTSALGHFLQQLEPPDLADDWLAVVGHELRPAFSAAGLPFPAAFDAALQAAAVRAGVTTADTDAQLASKLSLYLAGRAFPPAWGTTLTQLARDIAGDAAVVGGAALQAIGAAVSSRSALTAAPVAGASKLGALGRFSLQVPPKK